MALAKLSAHIIGAGPYADRLIVMLKRRIMCRRKQEAETVKSLVDMGFARAQVMQALAIKQSDKTTYKNDILFD